MLFFSRETVSADFMTACQFLKDHMDNMDNPNNDMVSSLDSSTGTFNKPKETNLFNIEADSRQS